MPRAFEIEQRRGMLGILKKVRSGLIYRDRTGARDWIGMLSGREAQGLKRGRFGCGHVELAKKDVAQMDFSRMCHKRSSIVSPGISMGQIERRCRCGAPAWVAVRRA